MRLDVKPILRNPEKRIPFRFELDLSDMDFSGRCPVSRPVTVEGEAYSSAEVLHLSLTAETVLDAMCDRCGKEVQVSADSNITEDWIIFCKDCAEEIGPIVIDD